jgi:NAD(P)-dependent dehydrogenase (short-subunit alcohol dehydrogenase family)
VRIEGASVVVTGGARGIGLRATAALLERGARVTIGATAEESLVAARRELGATNGLATVASDICTAAGCRAVADRALEAFGTIDALFTNAGLYAETPIEDTTEELWDRVINTNLKSVFFSIQAALDALRRARGVVVTMSSYNGVDGVSGNVGAYGAAKAGVINLTRALALDLAPDVRVNAIAPGFVETEKLRAIPDAAGVIEALGRMTPVGRIGRGDEIAGALLFAIENDFVNGTTITIDGGRSAGR